MGATPIEVKPLTRVNTTDLGALQGQGRVVGLPDGGYFVVWSDASLAYNADGAIVVGQRFDRTGAPVGGEIPFNAFKANLGLTGSAFNPAITAVPAGVVVAYLVQGSIDRVVVQSPYKNTAMHDNTSDPALTALADGSFVVAFTSGTGEDTDILFRRVVPGEFESLQTIHNEADNASDVALATLANGHWVAVYVDEFNGNAADTDILYRIFSGETPVTEGRFVPGGNETVSESTPDVAALTGGGFVVVWTDAGSTVNDIRATILTNAGTVVRSDILVNGTAVTGSQHHATVIGLLDGGFLVTWEDDNTGRIRAHRFDAAGDFVGSQYTVSAANRLNSDVARLADGRIVHTTAAGVGNVDVEHSIWNPRGTAAAIGDVLWQQRDGTVAAGTRELGRNNSNSWQVQDSGDFDGDGDSDVLWHHQQGQVVSWEVENGAFVRSRSLGTAGGSWEIGATGDIDDDGDDDILWHHGTTGQVIAWELEDGAFVRTRSLPTVAVSWELQGTGDFDRDGDDDILWHNASSNGAAVVWELENGTFVRTRSLPNSGSYEVAGIGDADRDGDADIYWQHSQGNAVIWQMQGGALAATRSLPNAGGSFDVEAVHDFDGDGDADMLWRHDTTGQVVTWTIQNAAFVQSNNFGVVGGDWQVRGAGEFA